MSVVSTGIASPQPNSTSSRRVTIEVAHAPTFNFAMEQSGVPLLTSVRVTNHGPTSVDAAELLVRIEPGIAPTLTHRVGRLRPGETVDLAALDVRAEPGRLRSVTEAERGRLIWELRSEGAVLAQGEGDIDVLAFNEWAGLRAPPALLATFVSPNVPTVTAVLQRVRERLRAATGDGGLTGYQSRSPERVRSMVRALYETLQERGISYVGSPASFEEAGQKIRLAETVVLEGMGNCLDLTVLVASCLEQLDLAPILVVQHGHALPGAWLVDDRFHDGVIYDAATLRNAAAIGQVLFFDSSTLAHEPRVPLENAEAEARQSLARDETLVCAIDVRVARRDRYRPLPLPLDTLHRALPIQEHFTPAASEVPPPRPPPLAPEAGPVRSDEGTTADAPSSKATNAADARLRHWRDRLLDLSLRNKLLNFRDDVKGALKLATLDIAKLEDLLAADTEVTVHPRPPTDERDARDPKLARTRVADSVIESDRARDLAAGVIHCVYDDVRMAKHAVHLEREARTALEEGGANVLYVAIGFLRWYESDETPGPKMAPLLLVPVKLAYARSSRRLSMVRLPEEPVVNHTLIEKVKRDFGVDLSPIAALDSDESGVDVCLLLRRARESIQRMKRWEVIEEAHIGLFSFAKFLMWKDLEENKASLLANAVVQHLAEGSNNAFPDRVAGVPTDRLDDEVPPHQLPLVIDADSSQIAAIHAALEGRSFVLQGPPGTGKSQTITNLIAAAMALGKTVLFVSEKMAALEVVQRRLASVGLGDFCLELHSQKTQKKQVIQALGKTLERGLAVRRPDWDSQSHELGQMRSTLNAYVRALHAPQPIGASFYQVSARVLALRKAPDVRVVRPCSLAMTREELNGARERASRFEGAATSVEPVAEHPFRDSTVEEWSAQRDQETRDALVDAERATAALRAATVAFARALGLSRALTLAGTERLASLAAVATIGPVPSQWRDDAAWFDLRRRTDAWVAACDAQARRRSDLAERWSDGVADPALAALEPLFAKWATAFFLFAWLFLSGARKRLGPVARTALPPNAQIAADLRTARATRDADHALAVELAFLRQAMTGSWSDETPNALGDILARGETLRSVRVRLGPPTEGDDSSQAMTDRILAFSDPGCSDRERRAIGAHATTIMQALAAYKSSTVSIVRLLGLRADAWPEDGPDHLERVEQQLRWWSSKMSAHRSWCLYARATTELRTAGLGAIADAHRAGALQASDSEAATERALLSAWVAAARDAAPVLRDFDGLHHHRVVERFRKADADHIDTARKHIVATLEGKLPRTGDAAASSEPGILKRELAKKTKHKALRKLLAEIPNLLTRLKPCLLMSPLSVAQYLPAGGRRFDIVVFDEASQIGPHDAIGAIARGNQVVIVGDSKQLPPTMFFQKANDDDEGPVDDNATEDMESILDQALASNMPEQMLGWHYRSRHEALIEFSNTKYYDKRLHIFPAARGRVPDLGVKFHHIREGVYDAGKTRQNALEAAAVVAELMSNLRVYAPAERSFGIVTFSAAQQELIEDLLQKERDRFPELEGHFAEDHPLGGEKVFVKNLETVQGDERDEVFFSIGYGRDVHGKLVMNFGPLNRHGGERRLNVAVTRARKQLRVFSSITGGDIDTNRTKARGTADLKAFLRFAEDRMTSSLETGDEPSGDFDSDFERDVYDVLRASGHRVHTQVGCGGYRIDLAVSHPKQKGVYALGIECDGAAYHSGPTARDRDRLRHSVLEGLGWKLHRIWSTDWIYERQREMARLEAAIEVACAAEPLAATAPSPVPPAVEVVAVDVGSNDSPPPSAAGTESTQGERRDASPMIPYRRARLDPVSSRPEDIYGAAHAGLLRSLVLQTLTVEAPIHVDELTRRIVTAFGSARIGERSRRRVLEIVPRASYVVDGDFVWDLLVDRPNWTQVRVPVPGEDAREPDLIPVEEIAAAARWVLATNLSLDTGDLVRQTARAFRIQRIGPKVDDRVRQGLALLMQRGQCEERGGRVEWRSHS
ncbi:MAG: DUF3320 domain-containing protein [Polyangiaceae bacterium]|nr:DUF3320 domain-containing protein [Polyangiaceae bacterium]